MSGDPHPFVTELAVRRRQLGWTQKTLAERAGIPLSTICQWESGHARPPLHRLEVVARALGMRLVLELDESFAELREAS